MTPDQKNVDGEQRIALCSLYLLFGIAMIAMSFNLVQEEVINSVKSVGKMLGILKDNEDYEEYYKSKYISPNVVMQASFPHLDKRKA